MVRDKPPDGGPVSQDNEDKGVKPSADPVIELLDVGGVDLFLGGLGALRIATWQHLEWYDYGVHWLLLSLTIGTALVGIVVWGTFVGGMLPLLFRRLGLDPATSSAPFVTTIVDISGIVIYFYTAMTILRGTLLP